MTDKIKENAILISKLIDAPAGAFVDSSKLEQYNGLMPIVFECNYQQEDLDIEIVMYGSGIDVHLDDKDVLITTFDTQLGFILALQGCVIKYLEVKND